MSALGELGYSNSLVMLKLGQVTHKKGIWKRDIRPPELNPPPTTSPVLGAVGLPPFKFLMVHLTLIWETWISIYKSSLKVNHTLTP